MQQPKTVVILSGGMDSVTLMWDLVKNKNHEVSAISFDYGQKHVKELQCAAWQCKQLGVPHKTVPLDFMTKLVSSSLFKDQDDIPEGHYEDESMKATVVPNRNMIMASIAVAWGISLKADQVALGVHAGDHTIYPDCRAPFIKAFTKTVELCDYHPISVIAPFQLLKKKDILEIGLQLGIDYAQTWTCYMGNDIPQKSGSTVERAEAFLELGQKDPLFDDASWNNMTEYLKTLRK